MSPAPSRTIGDRFFSAVSQSMDPRADCPKECKQPDGILEELEIDVFKDATGAPHLFQMSKGTPFGISLGQRIYAPSDPYIQTSSFRREITNAHPEFATGKLKWREHAAVVHLGGQLAAFFPVVSFYGGSFGPALGFSGDIILRYRMLSPQINDEVPELVLPLSPRKALEMIPGSEVEIIGLAALGVSVSLAVTEGQAQPPAMIGVTGYVSAGVAGAQELSVCVTALAEKGHVRLTHRRLQKRESSVGIGVTGGVMFNIGTFWASRIANNASILPNTATTSAYLNSLTSATTGNMSAALSTYTTDTIISCIDLDLNDTDAQRIYRMLLFLPVSYGIEEAKRYPHCAKIAEAHEHGKGNSESASARLSTETILQNATKKQEVNGHFSLPNGERVSYVDTVLGKTQSCWLRGNRSIQWEEVASSREGSTQTKSYVRFRYEDKDLNYNVTRLRKLLRFICAIGVDPETFIGGGIPRVKAVATRLSKSNKVELRMDIFISEEGLARIEQATERELQNAYLRASQIASLDYLGAPFLSNTEEDLLSQQWICTFEKRLQSHRFDVFGLSPSINECYKKYEAIKGRSLSMDYGLLKQSESFAKLIKQHGASKFFIELGKRKGFDYQQSVAALVGLAGIENTHVNELTLTGGPIKCVASTQSKIAHPQEGFAAYTVS